MNSLPGFLKYFLLFALCTLVSTLFSIDKIESLKDNRELFIFLLIPIIYIVINTKRRLMLSLYTVLFSAFLSSVYGIFLTIKAGGPSLDSRLQGFVSHWMTYSGLLMLVLIFFTVFIFYEGSGKTKFTIVLLLFPILSAILLSLTRSAWIGIVMALGGFIIFYKPKILAAIIPLFLIIILFLPTSVRNRIRSIADPHNETNRDRIFMLKTGWNIFKDYPLTGVGANNISGIYKQYKPPEAKLDNPHLHNNFIQILAERGLFALLALLAAIFSVFHLMIKQYRTSSPYVRSVVIASMFVFIGFLFSGLFEYNFGDSEIKFLLFFFLTIPFIKIENENHLSTGN